MFVEEFIDLLTKELEQNKQLRDYYRLIDLRSSFLFRKAYLQQRLQHVCKYVKGKNLRIWDVGCGYGTTGILMALAGHSVYATTLEYYFEKIRQRKEFWSKYGDLSEIDFRYENLFDTRVAPGSYDVIILQDTLHHLEPVDEAIKIFYSALKDNGCIIISEENGSNLICRLKHFKERGFNRIVELYDDKLDKKIFFGNENTRCLKKWRKLFRDQDLQIDESSVEFIRFFPPFFFSTNNYKKLIQIEQSVWKKSNLMKNYFFFGINFTVRKDILSIRNKNSGLPGKSIKYKNLLNAIY